MADEASQESGIPNLVAVASAVGTLIGTISLLAVTGALQEMQRDHGLWLIAAFAFVLAAAVIWVMLALNRPAAPAAGEKAAPVADSLPTAEKKNDVAAGLPAAREELKNALAALRTEVADAYRRSHYRLSIWKFEALQAKEKSQNLSPEQLQELRLAKARKVQAARLEELAHVHEGLDDQLAVAVNLLRARDVTARRLCGAVEVLANVDASLGRLEQFVQDLLRNNAAWNGVPTQATADRALAAIGATKSVISPALGWCSPDRGKQAGSDFVRRNGRRAVQALALVLFATGVSIGLAGMVKTQQAQERPIVSVTYDTKNHVISGSAAAHNLGTEGRMVTQIAGLIRKGGSSGFVEDVGYLAFTGPNGSGEAANAFSFQIPPGKYVAISVSATTANETSCKWNEKLGSPTGSAENPVVDAGLVKHQRELPGCILVYLTAEDAAPPSAREDDVARALDALIRTGVPGAVAFVRDGDQTILLARGEADRVTKTAMRPDDRFRVGGLTETFVATVVLQLVNEGRVALDQSANSIVPDMLRSDEITVRQLLQHTSGLYDFADDPAWSAPYADSDLGAHWLPGQLLAIVRPHVLRFTPGTTVHPSATDYVALGRIVESVTKHTLEYELEQRVFTPLGLDATSFATQPEIARAHARGYTRSADTLRDVTRLDPSGYWADGAVVSTVTDIAKFYRAALTDPALLPAELRREMTDTRDQVYPPTHDAYGLGVTLSQSLNIVPHAQLRCGPVWGNTGHIRGYTALAYASRDAQKQFVIFLNEDSDSWPGTARRR